MTSHCRRDIHNPMFTSKTPHFFKVILHATIRDGILGIPRKFVRKYGNQLSSHVKLEVPSGTIWQMELTKSHGSIQLKKGWREFSEHYSLECGSFLVFRYLGNDHFHVIIFDKSASEIEYKEKTDMPCPLPRRKRRSYSKFENSSSHISLDDPEKVASCSQKLTATEKAHAIRIANAFKSTGNTHFMVVMRQSCVGINYRMCIPSHFAREFLTMHKGNLTLCNSAGKTWPASYNANPKYESLNAYLYGGWRAFVEDNHLIVGDFCVFELIKHPEILMKVHIYSVVENARKASRPRGEFKGSAKHDNGGVSGCWGYQKPDHLGKNNMQPLTQTKKRRAADNASRSASSLVSRNSKEKSHLPCPLPRKKRRKLEVLSSDISPGDSKSSRINLGNLKKVEKSPGHVDAQRTVKTEAFSCVQMLTATEKARARQIASAFKSTVNPVFMVVMQPSFVCNNYIMCIPTDFARKFLRVRHCDLTLLNSAGKAWTVKYYSNATHKLPQAKFYGGWQTFVEDNHLFVSDICVFELIKQHPEIIMKVVINPVVKNASKACRPQAHGSIASGGKTRSLVSNTEPNCQQSSHPSSSSKLEDPTDSYIEILGDSPLNQKTKKKPTSPSFQSRKMMRTNPNGRTQPKGVQLEKEKKSMNFQYLTKELGELKYSAKDDSRRITGGRRCLKRDLTEKIKMEPWTSAFRTSNPSFSMVMHPSYIHSFTNVHIPKEFAKRYLKENGETVLRVKNGRTWTVEYKRKTINERSRTVFRGKSLRPFVVDNELKVGDVCIFEPIKENGNLLEVVIQRCKPLLIEID